jgi:hypothetical protein
MGVKMSVRGKALLIIAEAVAAGTVIRLGRGPTLVQDRKAVRRYDKRPVNRRGKRRVRNPTFRDSTSSFDGNRLAGCLLGAF